MALITKTYGRLLAALLSLLGFSAILSSCAKYGCPNGKIRPQITGSVVSEKSNAPVEGIRAVLIRGEHQGYGYDTAYTAKNGSFFLQPPHSICKEDADFFHVELQDVDGETNGSFENMEIPIALKSKQDLGIIRMIPKE